MRKIYGLIFILFAMFSTFLIVLFVPRSYELVYDVKTYEVKEIYEKELKYYKYFVTIDEKTFPLLVENKYAPGRKHITKIESVSEGNAQCITVFINNEKYPICYKNDNLIDYRLITEVKSEYQDLIVDHNREVIDTYESLKVFNYLDNSYYIWNYKGYYLLSKEQKKTINIIKDDDYNNALAYKINEYLLTPNYDSKYFFSEYLVINTKKDILTALKVDNEVSYSAYYLGNIGKDLYLVDKKNKTEYKINIDKKQVKIVGTEEKSGVWYNNGWENISLTKLVNKEQKFIKKQIYNYNLIDGKLYYVIDDYQMMISNDVVKEIVYTNEDQIYYLVEKTLYMYSPASGEVKIMENNEWLFNHNNQIFIF